MSDIPTVTYYAYSGTRYIGQYSGEDSAVLAFIAGKGYTTGPKPLASDRDLWVSIVSQATAAQESAEAAQEAVEDALAGLDFTADDRAKIDGIEDGADVTDAANVTAAGALMDSEVTNLADVKAFDPTDYQPVLAEGNFANGDKTKLDGIEDGADATDTANVTAAGAVMDSEVANLADVKAFDPNDYQTALSEGNFVDGDKTKLDGIEASADVTDTANVTAAGAVMDSEVANLADVKAFDPNDYATPAQGTKADSALQPTGAATLTGGFDSDEESLGTITSGTVTPEVDGAGEENFKTLTNNGAFTLAPPSTSSATTIRLRVINAASAGAITTSGFDKVNDPDGYATTNAKEYWFYIDHDSARSTLTISEIV